jgi:hypothetical protein
VGYGLQGAEAQALAQGILFFKAISFILDLSCMTFFIRESPDIL